MACRFASISDEEVKEFTENLENENTRKKTLYHKKCDCDEKVLLYFLFSCYKAQLYL